MTVQELIALLADQPQDAQAVGSFQFGCDGCGISVMAGGEKLVFIELPSTDWEVDLLKERMREMDRLAGKP